MTVPDKAHNYAYLFAESTTVPLDSIQSILGLVPDETTKVGDPIPYGPAGRFRRFTSWILYVPMSRGEHFGLDGLTRWLESLDDDLAGRFHRVSELGVSVGLNIVQNINAGDDLETQSRSRNFELSPAALRWLANSGAKVGIDQYLDLGHPDAAPDCER